MRRAELVGRAILKDPSKKHCIENQMLSLVVSCISQQTAARPSWSLGFYIWDPGAIFLGRSVKQETELLMRCLKIEKLKIGDRKYRHNFWGVRYRYVCPFMVVVVLGYILLPCLQKASVNLFTFNKETLYKGWVWDTVLFITAELSVGSN